MQLSRGMALSVAPRPSVRLSVRPSVHPSNQDQNDQRSIYYRRIHFISGNASLFWQSVISRSAACRRVAFHWLFLWELKKKLDRTELDCKDRQTTDGRNTVA